MTTLILRTDFLWVNLLQDGISYKPIQGMKMPLKMT
jgi:hypothetical protein